MLVISSKPFPGLRVTTEFCAMGTSDRVATTSSRREAVEIQMKSEPAEVLLSNQYLRHRLPVVYWRK
jgi:hypothetical protein